jgi:hypothetical protein
MKRKIGNDKNEVLGFREVLKQALYSGRLYYVHFRISASDSDDLAA